MLVNFYFCHSPFLCSKDFKFPELFASFMEGVKFQSPLTRYWGDSGWYFDIVLLMCLVCPEIDFSLVFRERFRLFYTLKGCFWLYFGLKKLICCMIFWLIFFFIFRISSDMNSKESKFFFVEGSPVYFWSFFIIDFYWCVNSESSKLYKNIFVG